jgi:hypothetical protein
MEYYMLCSDINNPLYIAKGNNGREFKSINSCNKLWFKVTSRERPNKGESGINITHNGLLQWINLWSKRRLKNKQIQLYKQWLINVLIPKLKNHKQ